MSEQEFLRIKKNMDSAAEKLSEAKGVEKTLLKQLKDEFGCKTIEEAEKLIASIDKELDEIDARIEEISEEVEQKLNVE